MQFQENASIKIHICPLKFWNETENKFKPHFIIVADITEDEIYFHCQVLYYKASSRKSILATILRPYSHNNLNKFPFNSMSETYISPIYNKSINGVWFNEGAHFGPIRSRNKVFYCILFSSFIVITHFLSLTHSHSLSLNFLLCLIPFINWSLLAPFPFPENISSSYWCRYVLFSLSYFFFLW